LVVLATGLFNKIAIMKKSKLIEAEKKNYPEIDRLIQEIRNDPEFIKEDEALTDKVAIVCLCVSVLMAIVCAIIKYAGAIQ